MATYLGGLAGVLGRYDEAEAYFVEAADLNARGSMVYAAARNDLAWARMLRARRAPGDQERALTALGTIKLGSGDHGVRLRCSSRPVGAGEVALRARALRPA